jgi:hypothetical protein
MIGARQRLFACVVVLATMQLLAGCNSVVSSTPWFGLTDAVGAPRLRDGVWRLQDPPDKPCDVDERRPLATWPDCAMGLVVKSGDLIVAKGGHDERDQEVWPYLIAGGEPPVMQVNDYGDASAKSYLYLGMRPVRLDAHGLAVVIKGWAVQCKPPPSAAAADSDAIPPLYPGFTGADNADCTADSVASLRAAAKASETDYSSDTLQAHWVRDGAQ